MTLLRFFVLFVLYAHTVWSDPAYYTTDRQVWVLLGGYQRLCEDFEGSYGSEIAFHELAKHLQNDYPDTIDVVAYSGSCPLHGRMLNNLIYYHDSLIEKHAREHGGFDVVVISRYFYYLLEQDLANRKLYRKVYMWAHDPSFLDWWVNGQRLDAGYMRNSTYLFTGYVFTSHVQKDAISRMYNLPLDRGHVIGLGLDPTKFEQQTDGKTRGKFISLSDPVRHLACLLYLWPYIEQKLPGAELYVYRPASAVPADLMAIMVENPRIHFGGKLTHDEAIQALLSSDVWLYPQSFFETFCMTALEAMAAQCSVIASDYGALSEIAGEGRGQLIPMDGYCGPEYRTNIMRAVIRVYAAFRDDLEQRAVSRQWALSQTWVAMTDKWVQAVTNDCTDGIVRRCPPSDIPPQPMVRIMLDKIVCLNLKRSPERRMEMEKELATSAPSARITQAVDGGEKHVMSLVPDFFRVNDHGNHPGVIGCAMSHAIQWAYAEHATLVLEDDVRVHSKLEQVVRSLALPMDWDVITLAENLEQMYYERPREDVTRYTFKQLNPSSWIPMSRAYLVNGNGAAKLLSIANRHGVKRAIDWFMIDQAGPVKIYAIHPPLVASKRMSYSDIWTTKRD